MTTTTHYGLKKPSYTDPADVNDLNYNSDTIDSALHSLDTDKEALANKSQDVATDAASTDKYPSAKAVADYVAAQIENKIDEPSSAGTEGQVLTLDNNLDPVWANSSGSLPAGTNNGDILVWNGSAWVSKPRWWIHYQPVEYIESTGTQYINTEIVPTLNDVVSFVAQHTEIESAGANLVASADYSANPITRFILGGYTPSSQNSEWQIACSDWVVWGVTADTNKHDFEYNASTKKYKIDETEYSSSPTVTDLPNVSLSIFCRHQKDTVNPYDFYNNLSKAKLYSLKIMRSGNLYADFRPCYRITDNEIGLYDAVNQKFYSNAGTGTFLKGADVY